MNTSIKEMSFSELNAQIEEFNKQIEKIRNKMEELVSEKQTRQEEAINNWKLHTRQILEATKIVMEASDAVVKDTKVLLDMGIDLHSLDVDLKEYNDNNYTDIIENEVSTDVIPESVSDSISIQDVDTTISYPTEELGTFDETVVEQQIENDSKEVSVETGSFIKRTKSRRRRFLKPFYEILEELEYVPPVHVKKETSDDKWIKRLKEKSNRFLTPYYEYFPEKGPVNMIMEIGNERYRESYPNPSEGRRVSIDGIVPTLTCCHSNIGLLIPPDVKERFIATMKKDDDTMETAA